MGSERKKKPKPRSNTDKTAMKNIGGRFISKHKETSGDSTTHIDKENVCDAKRMRKIITKIDIGGDSVLNSPPWNSSILHYLTRMSSGERCDSKLNQLQKSAIMNQISRYEVLRALTPFERRVTSIAWHPVHSQVVVAASKGGELLLQFVNKPDQIFKPGIGPGGSVVGLKFSAEDPDVVYTASITGNIMQEDLSGKTSMTLLSTFSSENWFSSLDIYHRNNMLITGDCRGYAYLITTSGEKIWPGRKRLHTGKITHAEFSPINPNIVVTSSLDKTVKLWDLRMVTEENQQSTPTRIFHHAKAVNSASFSPSSSYSLLTTDQHSEIRVYSSPCWDEMLIINHPHRKFQHITSIKAVWHPIENIIVVGRYPDDRFLSPDDRSIDFYDGSNGNLLLRKDSPTGNIVSLNAFNSTGDCMASSASGNLLLFCDGNVVDDLNNTSDTEHVTRAKLNMLKSQKRTPANNTKCRTRIIKTSKC